MFDHKAKALGITLVISVILILGVIFISPHFVLFAMMAIIVFVTIFVLVGIILDVLNS